MLALAANMVADLHFEVFFFSVFKTPSGGPSGTLCKTDTQTGGKQTERDVRPLRTLATAITHGVLYFFQTLPTGPV